MSAQAVGEDAVDQDEGVTARLVGPTGPSASRDDSAVGVFLAKRYREVVLPDVAALGLIEQRLGDDWTAVDVSFKIGQTETSDRRLVYAHLADPNVNELNIDTPSEYV